jgi:hypothetical protein
MMLLLHSHSLQLMALQAEHSLDTVAGEEGSSRKGVTAAAAAAGASGTAAADDDYGSSSSGSSSSRSRHSAQDDSSSSKLPPDVHEALDEEQFVALSSNIQGLWQQLGLSWDVLFTFAEAVHQTPQGLPEDPDVIEATARCVLLSLQHIMGLSTQQSQMPRTRSDANNSIAFNQLGRQVQQLLPYAVWRLPLLLLQIAELSNRDDDAAQHVFILVQGALVAVQSWGMPGLLRVARAVSSCTLGSVVPTAAAAAAAAAAQNPTAAEQGDDIAVLHINASFTELLPAMVDAWLRTVHSLLLQAPHGLLHTAAAVKPLLLSQHSCSCPVTLLCGTDAPLDQLSG